MNPGQVDDTLLFLHEAFRAFNESLSPDSGCWEAARQKAQQLQAHVQAKGLFGHNALSTLAQYRHQINWEVMAPDQFSQFYRFVFYLCREPSRRNIQTDLAVEAWRIILRGRFRLLDRWCCFVEAGQKNVITEDTWRQVFDFARTIHEDLGNYDPTGAWAVLLDEFVDEMRSQRRGGLASVCSSSSTPLHLDMDQLHGRAPPAVAVYMSPRCGSKRRGHDVDVVAEQLSTMDVHQGSGSGSLDAALEDGSGKPSTSATPKRMCLGSRPGPVVGHGFGGIGAGAAPVAGASSGGVDGALGAASACAQAFGQGAVGQPQVTHNAMDALQQELNTQPRRMLKIRRSGVSDYLLKSAVSDALGI